MGCARGTYSRLAVVRQEHVARLLLTPSVQVLVRPLIVSGVPAGCQAHLMVVRHSGPWFRGHPRSTLRRERHPLVEVGLQEGWGWPGRLQELPARNSTMA